MNVQRTHGKGKQWRSGAPGSATPAFGQRAGTLNRRGRQKHVKGLEMAAKRDRSGRGRSRPPSRSGNPTRPRGSPPLTLFQYSRVNEGERISVQETGIGSCLTWGVVPATFRAAGPPGGTVRRCCSGALRRRRLSTELGAEALIRPPAATPLLAPLPHGHHKSLAE